MADQAISAWSNRQYKEISHVAMWVNFAYFPSAKVRVKFATVQIRACQLGYTLKTFTLKLDTKSAPYCFLGAFHNTIGIFLLLLLLLNALSQNSAFSIIYFMFCLLSHILPRTLSTALALKASCWF